MLGKYIRKVRGDRYHMMSKEEKKGHEYMEVKPIDMNGKYEPLGKSGNMPRVVEGIKSMLGL